MGHDWFSTSNLIGLGSLLAALVAAAYGALSWHTRPRGQLSVDMVWQDTWFPAGADETLENGVTYLWVRVTNISAISTVDTTVTVPGALGDDTRVVGVMLPGAFETTTLRIDPSSPEQLMMKLTWIDMSRSRRKLRTITRMVPPYSPSNEVVSQ